MAPPPTHPPKSFNACINFFNDANLASLQRLFSQREQRQRLGTSANDSTRTNAKAEALAQQAADLENTRAAAAAAAAGVAGRHQFYAGAAAGGGRQYYEQAVALYTQAIDLDSFNHLYFYHRAQLFLQCDRPLASTDAQFALDLLDSAIETYRHDDIFCSLWLILVESELKMCELHNAQRHVQVALSVVPPTQALRPRLQTFQRVIQQQLNEVQRRVFEMDHGTVGVKCSSIPVRLQTVMDDGDDILFVYTSQIRFSSPNAPVPVTKAQAELLAVDLPAAMLTSGDMQLVFQHVLSKKLSGISAFAAMTLSSIGRRDGEGEQEGEQQQQVMEAFQTPDGRYSITPILVVRQDDCQALQRYLMCDCRDDCCIVVLKVDKTNAVKEKSKNSKNDTAAGSDTMLTNDESATTVVKNNPRTLSEVQAKAYIATIVKNAPICQERYKKGIKLVDEEQMIHQVTKRMSNLISSSSSDAGGISSTTTTTPTTTSRNKNSSRKKKSSHTK